jgi:protein tyrosine/serine phosphatase
VNSSTRDPRRHPLDLERVFNFRDIGGYAGLAGRTLAWKRLYRADGLNRATDSDVESLRTIGIRTIVDLRTHAELAESGTAAHESLDAHFFHRPLIDELWPDDDDARGDDPTRFLVDRYHEMADRAAAVLPELIGWVAHEPEHTPVVFHCSAGKDRTGVTAAVLLGLAGVDHETIAADYHLSGLAMAALVAWVRTLDTGATTPMVDQPPVFLSCPPEAMLTFLAEIDAQHGDMEGFVRSLGVDDATIAQYRKSILV